MSEEVQTPETPAVEQTPSQPVSMTTSEGTWNPDYLSSLPDGLGEHSSFQKYATPEDYFKGSMNAQKLIGEKAADFWKSEDPEHIAVRKEIMGVPKEASEYVYEGIELPEGMDPDFVAQRVDSAKEKLFELGLSKEQAKALIEWDIQSGVEQFNTARDSQAQNLEQAKQQLQSEWKGEAFQNNAEKVKNTLEYLGLEEFANDPKYANDPKFIKGVFDKIVPLVSDDTIIEARQSQNIATMQDQWDAQYNKMAMMDRNDPNYSLEVAKMRAITDKIDQMQN